MKQEDVVEMNLAELVELNLIPRTHLNTVRVRLERIWVAGWEEGRGAQYAKRKPVIKFDLSGGRITEYASASEAARKNNLTKHSISKACLGKTRTAGGYIWRYKDK